MWRARRQSIAALAVCSSLLAACGDSVNVPIELEFTRDSGDPIDTVAADDTVPGDTGSEEAEGDAGPDSATADALAGDSTAIDVGVDSVSVDTRVMDTLDTSARDSISVDTLVDSSVRDDGSSVDSTAVVDTFVPPDTFTPPDSVAVDSAPTDTGSADMVTIAVADVSIAEGNAGIKSAMFLVRLSSSSTKTVTVSYATADGTATAVGAAATGGKDYSATWGSLTFAPGETSKIVYVPINGDTIDEDDETFNFMLTSPTNATLFDSTAVGTITNDDTMPTLTIDDAAANEGLSGQKSVTFNVLLSTASGRTVTVAYATSDGTATVGSDYVATSGSLVFEPGTTKKTIQVQLFGDAVIEPDETFLITLTTPKNATLAKGTGTGRIINDD